MHYIEVDWVDLSALNAARAAYPNLSFNVLTEDGPGGGNPLISVEGDKRECRKFFLGDMYGGDLDVWNVFHSQSLPVEQRWAQVNR